MRKLIDGDIIRNRGNGLGYVVIQGEAPLRAAVAVRSVEVTNPDEWELVDRNTNRTVSDLLAEADALADQRAELLRQVNNLERLR